ncbi:uncharacterized protein LOC124821627 [Vigna umbellata]|uniref:uncharacterized protein LOC124821627 n=1 Tax=Vigna umbellata TaxID=87088 RepID=UPI001F5FE84D|nr:uncharacterized protein LOC124821627 [Vigna umbellata]
MIKLLFFVFWLLNSHDSHRVNAIHIDDLEIERQLQFLNKPSRKSIQTEFGYIVDCVDIYKQPAFDHPLLKNHKLQRKPSFQNSFRKTSVNNSSNKLIFGLQKEKCPMETVPIRRTTKDDLIQGKSLLYIYNQSLVQDNPGVHMAELYVIEEMGPFYQVKGISSVYNPRVLKKNVNQVSISHIWVENDHRTNKIAFGWQVAPELYGRDTGTHLFSIWTTDNFNHTGCYNQQCRGFVQTNRDEFLGSRLSKTSVYGGTTVEISISITVVEFGINYVVLLV